ncbi:MAG: hypothetical protein JW741_28910, partial [Sedimentisphaerales bacterium]|nr:hypothetical protein [Sedimentisphaerales bacterium]
MILKRVSGRLTWTVGYVLFVLGLSVRVGLAADDISPEVANLYNLVKNGGFEEGERLPAAWARYPKEDQGGNVQLRDTRMFLTGKASGLIWSVTPYEPGKPPMQWNQYGVPVEGGATLIVSMAMKTEGAAPGHGGIHFYAKDRTHLGFAKINGPKTANDWAHVRQDVVVPQDAATIGFVAYASEKGKTWYDDLAVIGAPSATAARATPTVDGALDDSCWSRDAAVTTFVSHTGSRIITEPVQAWLAYDDQNVYVAFRCPHPLGAKLREEATQHDGDTWLDDSIEVFLDPGRRCSDYVQFCVNCRGAIRDSHGTDAAWESGARAAVQRGQTEWTVEIAIPLDSLGIGLDVGDTWGVNLVWNDRVRGQTATWSLGGFHAPGRFGAVRLEPDLERFYRSDVVKTVKEKEQRGQAVLKELQGAELPENVLAVGRRLLDKAKTDLDALRTIGAGEAKLPDGGWPAVRKMLTDASNTLASARAAAVEELFRAGASDGRGFRVAIARSLQKVRRTGPITDAPLTRRVRLDAARDEAESFQLVVMPDGQALKGVTVEAKPLTGDGGAIPVEWRRVDYVETAKPPYPTEYVGWWPDPLLPAGPFDVAAGERQPLWFTVMAPP